MVQTVELLPDAVTDSVVRTQWGALLAAGLPSQARHTGATNAPHVTLGVSAAVPHSVSDMAGVLDDCPGQRDLLAPGRWTAHITLARGLREDQLGAALVVCAGEEVDGSAVAARRYDGDARSARLL